MTFEIGNCRSVNVGKLVDFHDYCFIWFLLTMDSFDCSDNVVGSTSGRAAGRTITKGFEKVEKHRRAKTG